MIDFYLNLVFFFSISLVYFYSVVGYGKILAKTNLNYFETYLDGTVILLILGYIIYVTFGTNITINIFIISFGLILNFKINRELRSIKNIYIIFLLLVIFSVLIISKTHEDFNTYHYFAIYEIFNHNLRIGVSQLNEKFFHSSLLAINQSLIILPFINFKLVHLSSFFIYFSVIGYFILNLFTKEKDNKEVFFSILCLFILLVKFNRLSEYGYDYISQFILLIVFHKIYFLHTDNNEIIKSILYFVLSVLIKPISLLFLPIMIFIFYKKGFYFYKKINKSNYIILFSLLIILFSSSFFKSGCLFYPLNKTCFSISTISWAEKDRIKDYSESVSLWAKGFYAQDKTEYTKIDDKNFFGKNFNWVKYWIELHFFYKIFEFLLIVIISILIIYFYFKKVKLNLSDSKNDKFILLFLSFLSIIFWFNTVPQFRFGISSIIIFFYIIFDLLLGLKIYFSKKKFIRIFILGLLILNYKNINRIYSEFERDDFYKFNNFPYYNEIEINNDYSNLSIDQIFHINILK